MDYPQTNRIDLKAPTFRGLTDEQCRLIQNASLEILEHTGVLLDYKPAIDLLKKAGCVVDGNRVRIPNHLVSWALGTAPNQIMIYDRFGKPAMPIGGRISTFGTGSDCLNILDHNSGERRKALLQDVIDGTRVTDSMPHIDFIMSMFLPGDVPDAADVLQMEVMLNYSSKPICFVTYEWEGTADIIEMLELAVGGEDQLRINPTAILYLNPMTAFRHNEEALHKLMFAAEKRFPFVYLPDVQRGFTCPITYAGAMACANAGQLVGLLIAQLVNEGTPVILNAATPSTIDMKTMVLPYSEPAGKAFSLEMNFYYDLPTFSTGGCSDSKAAATQN